SATAVIEGMNLERQQHFALQPFVHFNQEILADESERLLTEKRNSAYRPTPACRVSKAPSYGYSCFASTKQP
ncbi:MAG: hypothetical protein KBF63_21080, partial [Rhodoferax sp.]|nr:hypothetical protein [Rhodoferax sp.]